MSSSVLVQTECHTESEPRAPHERSWRRTSTLSFNSTFFAVSPFSVLSFCTERERQSGAGSACTIRVYSHIWMVPLRTSRCFSSGHCCISLWFTVVPRNCRVFLTTSSMAQKSHVCRSRPPRTLRIMCSGFAYVQAFAQKSSTVTKPKARAGTERHGRAKP